MDPRKACRWFRTEANDAANFVSGQVVPIGPATLLGDPDRALAERALPAMLGMRKLDIDALRKAADGAGAA